MKKPLVLAILFVRFSIYTTSAAGWPAPMSMPPQNMPEGTPGKTLTAEELEKAREAVRKAMETPSSYKPGDIPLIKSDTVIWAGLDYSMVRMIGTNDFNVPDLIFPGRLDKWNALFLDERIERVAHTLGKRVLVDIGGVTELNKTANKDQIILRRGSQRAITEKSHITPENIATTIKSYKLENTNGLGLVFIVDRLVERYYGPPAPISNPNFVQSGTYEAACGAVYIVFFDVATREVISVDRKIHSVDAGANFRNFWFGIIKDTDGDLGKYR
jgi:hypothetical protein